MRPRIWHTTVLSAALFLVIFLIMKLPVTGYKTVGPGSSDAPLPSYELKKVEQDVSPEFAKFMGLWSKGKWEGVLDYKLIVESVDRDGNASIIACWGKYDKWRIFREL